MHDNFLIDDYTFFLNFLYIADVYFRQFVKHDPGSMIFNLCGGHSVYLVYALLAGLLWFGISVLTVLF